jgi:uncharacterized cupin superfamily protein
MREIGEEIDMKIVQLKTFCDALLVIVLLMLASLQAAAEPLTKNDGAAPLRIDRDAIGGIGLEPVAWDDPTRSAKWSFLYRGDELSVSVFQSSPAGEDKSVISSKARVKNYPYDQFVIVLSGKSVLTPDNGVSQTFSVGDFFVVPKGFSGTWEEIGNYRELIVIDETAVRTRSLEIEPAD